MRRILWTLVIGALSCLMSCDTAEKGTQAVAAEETVVRLWPIDRVGGEKNRLKEDSQPRGAGKITYRNIKDPNLTIYPVQGSQPTPAVVYCPGGAYKQVSVLQDYIDGLNGAGITVFLLKYTVPDDREAAYRDVQRAMRLVRHHAEEWKVDPDQLGVIGNSAGGHLVARLSQNYATPAYAALDEVDRESCEPRFVIVTSGAYFATDKSGSELAREFHNRNAVAPTLLVYAKDDHRYYAGGVAYEKALEAAGSPVRMLAYDHGGHGMKGVNWFPECEKWLKEIGIQIHDPK